MANRVTDYIDTRYARATVEYPATTDRRDHFENSHYCYSCGSGLGKGGRESFTYTEEYIEKEGVIRFTCNNCKGQWDDPIDRIRWVYDEPMNPSALIHIVDATKDAHMVRCSLSYRDAPIIRALTDWLEQDAYNYSFRPNPWTRDDPLEEKVEFSDYPGAFFDEGPKVAAKATVVGTQESDTSFGEPKIWIYGRYDSIEEAQEMANALNVVHKNSLGRSYRAIDKERMEGLNE